MVVAPSVAVRTDSFDDMDQALEQLFSEIAQPVSTPATPSKAADPAAVSLPLSAGFSWVPNSYVLHADDGTVWSPPESRSASEPEPVIKVIMNRLPPATVSAGVVSYLSLIHI